MSSTESRDDTIVQEITIKASAERVFEALTDPRQRMKWWGAEGLYRATDMESDLRPGGKWSTRGTGYGKSFSVRGEYRVIERPRVLAFTWIPDWQENAPESLVRFDLTERTASPRCASPIRASRRRAGRRIAAGRRCSAG
jgi:uncharacterized protein YndB with AHSA1/START domain